jgi:hypothetical protein
MQFQPAPVEKTVKARFAENLEPAAERAAAQKKKVAAKQKEMKPTSRDP